MIEKTALEKYLHRRKEDLKNCQEAFARRDHVLIGQVGHKIRGNGSTFGYPELSMLGESLELAAAEENFLEIQSCLELFRNWVNTHDLHPQ